MTDAVLLMAYGGPDALDDVPAYLSSVRGGRATPPQLLAEITRRYALIGGRSPLPEITQRTAAKLSAALGRPVYVGMRHWRPAIAQAVASMAEAGVRRATAICLAPHYSRLSTGAYRARLEEAVAAAGGGLQVRCVESWHTEPAYLDGLAENVRGALARFPAPAAGSAGPTVIFTAHSLPAEILAEGDPYERQLEETARLVAARLGLPEARWTRGYQSAAHGATAWLGPQVEALLPQLAAGGVRELVLAPIGFITDNVEVLYDLDIAAQGLAAACGVRVVRAALLNDTAPLIAALAAVAQERP